MGKTNVEYADVQVSIYPAPCHFRCRYCLPADTRILTADLIWKKISEIKVGETLIGFDEISPPNGYRRLRLAKVLGKLRRTDEVFRIITEKGEVKATRDHLWLVLNEKRCLTGQRCWRPTSSLREGWKLLFLSKPVNFEKFSADYMDGYIAGLTEGDGTFRLTPEGKRHKTSYYRIALTDKEPLYRLQMLLKARLGEEFPIKNFSGANASPMWKIETWTSRIVEEILNLDATSESREFKRGYLAGIFDSEGSYSTHILRIANKDEDILSKIEKFGKEFGFIFKRERYKPLPTVRLEGDIGEKIRFFATTNPSISRKKLTVLGHSRFLHLAEILKIERLQPMEVWDLTTTTHTFFANGFASHNCWAKLPIWRYRLRSPKPLQEAERLARSKTSKRVVVSFTGDPYQPKESYKKLTRKVLEMLVCTRHEVYVLTKNPLFALKRDLDLLVKPNFHLGTTLTSTRKIPDEPYAPSNPARIAALEVAHGEGVKTWVSIEPWLKSVTVPEEIIMETHRFVDWYVIGRHNYEYAGNYPKVPDRFYAERLPRVIKLLKDLEKPFFIKKELKRCLPEGNLSVTTSSH